MPTDLNNQQPIDPNDPAIRAMFQNLQGNILKGHGRDHTVNLFIKLGADLDEVRAGLSTLAKRIVTSALQQNIETKQYKEFHIPGSMFGSLLLTANGYRALGFTELQLQDAFPEPNGDFGVQSNFREGMQAHGDELNDPDAATWDEGYRPGNIDALILIADDDRDFLHRQARSIINEVQGFATVLAVELGDALRNEEGEGIEHFGYVDGRSQPIYLTTDLAGEGSTTIWNPAEPLSRVLVQDRTVATADAFGSYYVFRKLEQDVLHFKIREQELADVLGLVGSDRERAGAMAVGRFEDGTPVVLSQTDGFIPLKENNFRFDNQNESKCPFQAHIRKSNPRGDITVRFGVPEETAERARRITRRGITFGKRNQHPHVLQGLDDLPTGGVGLLFACFQASIANQFAFIQSQWVNSEDFVSAGTGLDPVLGQKAAGSTPAPQKWPAQWGQPATQDFAFAQFVTLRGGEFFFAPSIPFLDVLAPPAP